MANGSRPANILVRVSRSMFCSSSCFTGRGSLSGPICYFVIMVMPPRERMLSTRETWVLLSINVFVLLLMIQLRLFQCDSLRSEKGNSLVGVRVY